MATPLLLKYKIVEDINDFESLFAFSKKLKMWLDRKGCPIFQSRSSRPFTPAHTATRWVKPGYTPSGKYKSGKWLPAKMDKRAGK